jgi:hypothetical protein
MAVTIIGASMSRDEGGGFTGRVQFEVDGHKRPYEVALFSKNRKEWDYSLMFAQDPGSEEEMLRVEEMLENDDELFDSLVDAAESKL